MKELKKIFGLIRFPFLIIAILSYVLGLAINHYLMGKIYLESQYLGGLILFFILSSSSLLGEYFRTPVEITNDGNSAAEREIFRIQILLISITIIAIAFYLIFILIKDGYFSVEVWLILPVIILLALAKVLPPIRLENHGIGELLSAFLETSLSTAFAFLLQHNSFHRMLTIFSLPMFFLVLAYYMVQNFSEYSKHIKSGHESFLLKLSWQNGIKVHNGLLVSAYLFLAIVSFFGISIQLIFPVFLTFPLAFYQIVSINNVANGGKPIWQILKNTAAAICGLSIYLIILTLWLH